MLEKYLSFINKPLGSLFISITLLLFIFPFVLKQIIKSKIEREKETAFLEFIRDLVESVKTGTPIVNAILTLEKRDYGYLNSHISKLAKQISLGIPLTASLENFAKDTKNSLISRSIELLSEANKSGGEIETVLESIYISINQIQNIKKEIRSSMYNITTQGYIIFTIFIFVIIILEFFFFPKLENLTSSEVSFVLEQRQIQKQDLSNILLWLLIIQSFFSGLVIGKVSEGKALSGLKHSFILLTMALLIFNLAKVFFG